MNDVVAAVNAKLQRAKEHIKEIEVEGETFLNKAPQRVFEGVDPKARRAFRDSHLRRPIPIRLRILTGEAIQQIRSCLDYMVCALIVSEGGTPNRNSHFPVTRRKPRSKDQLGTYNAQIEGIKRIAVRTIIDRHQPYKFGARRERHWLAVLANFNNRDKHEFLLLPTVWVEGRVDFDFRSGRVSHSIGRPEKRTKMPIALGARGKPIKVVNVKHRLVTQIAFDRWGDKKEPVEVTYGLNSLSTGVVRVVTELSPFVA